MLKGLLLGVGLLVLIASSIGGTVFFMKSRAPAMVTASAESEPAAGAALPVEARPKVFYHHIQPEFVANLPGKGRQRFALMEMAVALNDEEATRILDQNGPELRNNLLSMLSEQTEESLAGNEGKTALRARSGEIIEELLSKHYGSGRVVDVYLTRFVVQ